MAMVNGKILKSRLLGCWCQILLYFYRDRDLNNKIIRYLIMIVDDTIAVEGL